MKIQNKRARIWIGLGLLGLILTVTKSVFGLSVGGILGEIVSGGTIIFFVIGWYTESRSKKKNKSGGFIPLVVAIIIGFLAVAGGTTAIVLSKKGPVEAPKQPQGAPTKDVGVQRVQTGSGGNKPIPGILGKTTIKATPEKKEVESVDIKPVVEEKKQPAEVIALVKVHPGVAYIDTFLNNPTFENLKIFCNAAKSMEGYSEEKVLNQDRTNYEMKKRSLYKETNGVCLMALGEAPGSESYAWTYYSESYLLPLTDQGESDDLRKKKIEYNSIMAGIPPSKLFGYDKSFAGADHPTNTPREVVEAIFARPSSTKSISTTWSYYRIFTRSFIVPEKRLKELREKLLRMPGTNQT